MKIKGFSHWDLYDFAWPKLSYIKLKIKLLKPSNRATLASISQQFNAKTFESEQDRINFIRNWVNTNSTHLIDAEHDSYAFNVPEVLSRLNAHALGDNEKPHLSCGPRAYAMKAILDYMKIQSRIIDLFGLTEVGSRNLKVSPHTLIEVRDSDTKKWVLHDPDFNIAYANKNTHIYQSAQEMLQLKAEEKGHETAGYEIENLLNLQNTLKSLFEWGILYRYSYEGKQSVLIHNNDKIMSMKVDDSMDVRGFIMQRAFFLKSFKL